MKGELFRRLMSPSDIRTCIGGAGILGAIAAGMASQGCSSVCAQIEAVAPQLNAKLADTQRAITEVENSGIRDRLSGKQLEKFNAALEKVREGHNLAVRSVALADKACKDPKPAIDMIVTGWDVVRTFLALVGGDGTPAIVDPIIWREARS